MTVRMVEGWACPQLLGGPGNYLRRALDCGRALSHCRGFGFAVQAGGHIGTVPAFLGEHFDDVLTLEPHPDNFAALAQNITARQINAVAMQAAFGHTRGLAPLRPHKRISGQHQVSLDRFAAGDQTPRSEAECVVTTIDTMVGGRPLDAVFLDVEGTEMHALAGATMAIARWRPVIMVEENKRCRDHGFKLGDLKRFLTAKGYELVDHIGEDFVYAPRP